MSAQELEAACRKCVRMTVTDTRALARVLNGMHIEYQILDSTTADVYAKPNFTQLAMVLSKENCEVVSMEEHDENLESFYVNLVGGTNHE